MKGEADLSLEHPSAVNLHPLGALTRHLYHHIFVFVERPRAIGLGRNIVYPFDRHVWLFTALSFVTVVLVTIVIATFWDGIDKRPKLVTLELRIHTQTRWQLN